MIMLPLVYFSILFTARWATAYDPKQLVRGYLVISHQILAKILISQSDPLTGRNKNRKENRNKMSFLGLGLYVLCALTFLFHAVLFLTEPISALEYTIDTRLIYLHANNLNEAIVVLSALIVLLINVSADVINSFALTIRGPKVSGRKLTLCIYSLFIVMILVVAISKLIELFHFIGLI